MDTKFWYNSSLMNSTFENEIYVLIWSLKAENLIEKKKLMKKSSQVKLCSNSSYIFSPLKKLVKETDIKCKFGNCLKDKMFKRVTTSKYETNVYVLHYDCSPEK